MGLGLLNISSLRQGIALLEQLDDDLFTVTPPGLDSGGVGPQFRHIIDYYQCLLRDLASGSIDYDRRQRDPEVETSRDAALARLRQLVDDLRAVDLEAAPSDLRIRVDADPAAPDDWGRSSVFRELQFLLSHTIHHYAIIAVTLHGHGFTPPSGFGVAPSTLRHWASTTDLTR